MSALRASIVCYPRPYGRGYYMTALRACESHLRPEGPLCSSHDRKVVVTSVWNHFGGPKDRQETPFMSALRASILLLGRLPRPYGRGYCMMALRACEPLLSLRTCELVSIPQVFLVVIDFVLDQEFKIFFLEGAFSMMLTLVANVSDDSLFF